MGMVTWIKNVISSVLPASAGQGAEAFEEKARPKLFDVTDGYYLVEEAKKWGINFIRRSREDLGDLRMRFRTRRKVRKGLADSYDLPEIVDEVTEKLVNSARHDAHYKRMVG